MVVYLLYRGTGGIRRIRGFKVNLWGQVVSEEYENLRLLKWGPSRDEKTYELKNNVRVNLLLVWIKSLLNCTLFCLESE